MEATTIAVKMAIIDIVLKEDYLFEILLMFVFCFFPIPVLSAQPPVLHPVLPQGEVGTGGRT